MRAVQYSDYGTAAVLHIEAVPVPSPQPREVLVCVRGASVNGIDVVVRSGKLRLLTGSKFPRRVGLDFAGEVVTVGSEVIDLQAGDRVWGIVSEKTFGSAAEFVSAPRQSVSRSPRGLDLLQAAALPVVGVTALIALRDVARLNRGERLLVRGAAGGVGAVAVQLGRDMGAHVTALAAASSKAYVESLGADSVLDYAITGPDGLGTYDVIFDTVGSDTHLFRRQLTVKGRMVTICPDPKHPVRSMLYIAFSWIYGARRVRFFSARPDSKLLADLASFVERGVVTPCVGSTYPLERTADAHRDYEQGRGRGKRVVDMSI